MERLNITVEKTPDETGEFIRISIGGKSMLLLDEMGAKQIADGLARVGITAPDRKPDEIREIPATLESIRDPSVVYLEAILQAQAAHLADTRGILELTLNHIFGGRPAPQPTTPGDNNV